MQTKEFRGVATTTFSDENGDLVGIYHETAVCKRQSDGKVKLNSGGWKTKTTLARMNQFSHAYCGNRFAVVQRAHKWYVMFRSTKEGEYWDEAGKIPFTDGMII